MTIYKLVWDDFCSWYLEMIKPEYGQPIDKVTYDDTIEYLESLLKILHPFMPFLTEEIWQFITTREPEDALIISKWPKYEKHEGLVEEFNNYISNFEFAKEVIAGIRTIRKEKNISFKESIDLKILNNENASTYFNKVIQKMGNIQNLEYVNEKVSNTLSYRVKSNEYFIPISGNINIEEELKKLSEELEYTKGFLKSVQAKLNNEKFVNGAPKQVIENELKKESDALAKIATLEQSIASLK